MKREDVVKPIKTILWATDFSRESRFCLPYVKLFANALKTKNYALYVLPKFSDWVYETAFLADDGELLDTIEKTRKNSMAKIHSTSKKSGIDFEARLLEGIESKEIIDFAKGNEVDLIFAGRRGISEIEQILIGSTTSRLIRNSDLPVLVIPKNKRDVKIEKILCPLDFSDSGLMELEYAISLSRQFKAELCVVHVTEFFNYRVPVFKREQLIEKVNKKITAIAMEQGYEVDKMNIIDDIGEPAHKIIEVAKKRKMDVIIMATHQRKGIEKLFLGSITEKVIMYSDIPVIVLPPPGK